MSGIPEQYLRQFDLRKAGDQNKIIEASNKLDEFKGIAEKIQAIYLLNPALDIPPSSVSKNPKATAVEYKRIEELYTDLIKADAEMAKLLMRNVGKGKMSLFLDLNNEAWSNILMGKAFPRDYWERK